MFLFLVHMPKAIYITGNLLYCIQQLKTLQIGTLRGNNNCKMSFKTFPPVTRQIYYV